jgi:dTDP-4-amino-4,6-dideoxygalactose transaminase
MSIASPERAPQLPRLGEKEPAAASLPSSRYEEEFARSVNAAHAIAFGYARHALITILDAAGVEPGDEVILSPLTCKVVPLALLSLKLKPVYADISAETLNLDWRRVERAIRPATRAVLFQHTYGNLAGIEEVAGIAARKNLLLIEDCAQCMPYRAKGYSPGGWGRAAIFSNNLLKPLPAGSGGVAVTGDYELARKIQERRDELPPKGIWADLWLRAEKLAHRYFLKPTWYWRLFNLYRSVSPNYRMRPVEVEITKEIARQAHRVSRYQASEGISWLSQVVAHADHRRLCCEEYARALSDPTRNIAESLQLVPISAAHPLFYFPVLANNKRELLSEARTRRIEVIAWPTSTPIYPIEHARELRAYGYEPGCCPVAEDVAGRLIGLPTHMQITPSDRRRIVTLLAGTKN